MNKLCLWLLTATCTLLTTSVFAAEVATTSGLAPADAFPAPTAYTAELVLTYNGSLQSRPKAVLESLGKDRYRYTLSAKGDKGLAWLARANDVEMGEFLWNNGQPKPLIFQRKLKYIGTRDNWFSAFDWATENVSIRHNNKTLKLKLKPETLDPVTFLFQLQHATKQGETQFNINMLDKDKIKLKQFKVSKKENLQTAFGCLPTIKVIRTGRKPGKFQHHWLAPDLENIVVLTETGKVDGRQVRLEIKKLSFAGQPVEVKDRCTEKNT